MGTPAPLFYFPKRTDLSEQGLLPLATSLCKTQSKCPRVCVRVVLIKEAETQAVHFLLVTSLMCTKGKLGGPVDIVPFCFPW